MKEKDNKNRNKDTRDRSLKGNNQGSSIVLVIIAVAFVAMLGSIILMVSITNMQMKYTDLKSKKSFYSAESVIDQISVGLQKDVSNALSKAYSDVMQKYAVETETVRENNFKYNYIKYLRSSLQAAGDDSHYNMDKLKGYLNNPSLTNPILETTEAYKMDALTTGIILRGIKVTYTNAEGMVSIIETDIKLAIPDVNFTQSSSMPDLFKYCMISNNQLFGNNSGTVAIKGNLYGGENGIIVNGTSNWTISDAVRVVTDATVSVTGPNAKLTVGSGIMLWAKNLMVNNGTLELHGNSYIQDDLSLAGINSNVILKNEYYGYGNSTTDASLSSSIIVNATDGSIDMSGLNKLLLSGNAYIGTGDVTYTPNSTFSGGNNKDILMGESLAVKSDQLIYLVPSQCIGVNGNEVLIGKNPMSSTEYQQLLTFAASTDASYASFEEVAVNKTITSLGKSLKSYIEDGTTGYQTIFKTVNGETLVYYYLVLDETNANQYFRDYYGVNKAQLDAYTNLYVKDIVTNNNFTRFTVNGNVMTYTGNAATIVADTKPTVTEEMEALAIEESSYSNVFEALTTKLITNKFELSVTEKTQSVFQNIVSESVFTTFVNSFGSPNSNCLGNEYVFQQDPTVNGLQAVFLDNEKTATRTGSIEDYTYDYDSTQSSNIRLIIATGNVRISKDFSGLVIAKGSIEVVHADLIENKEEDLTKVLQYQSSVASGEKSVIDFFVNGPQYILDGTSVSGSSSSENDGVIQVSDLILYENWSKQ